MVEDKLSRWYWALISLSVVVAYMPAPWGAMVWDDQLVLRDQIAPFRSLADILRPPYGIPEWSYFYYRPLITASYLLDATLFGPTAPAARHLMNVAYHLITTLLVWALARRLLADSSQGRTGALVAALIFGVHPIHTETVSWIAGRSDMLATLFLLPALLLALQWRDRDSVAALWFGSVCFLLALLAKETSLAGLILLPLLLAAVPCRSPVAQATTRLRRQLVMWSAVAVSYLGATWLYWSLRRAATLDAQRFFDIQWPEALWQSLRGLAYYLIKVTVPWPQANLVVWATMPGITVSIAALVLALIVLAWAIRLWWKCQARSALLGVFWFAAALAPSLLIALLGDSGAPVAERYLYLPSVGAALLLGEACYRLLITRWAKAAILGFGLVIVAYGAATIQRGLVWLDELSLWTDATAHAPSHPLPWIRLGQAYAARGEEERALQYFRTAERLDGIGPVRATLQVNIGFIHLGQGQLDSAELAFGAATGDDPSNAMAQLGLGQVWYLRALRTETQFGNPPRSLTQLREATAHVNKALEQNPRFTEAYLQLAQVLLAEGDLLAREGGTSQAAQRYEAAMTVLETAVQTNPATELREDFQQLRARAAMSVRRLRA